MTMLLRLSILCLFVLLGFSAQAQDTLYQKNGSKLVIKVLEVGETNVKYKRYSNLDGPVYTVAKQDITKITYPNGDVDVFMPAPRSSSSNTSGKANKQNEYEVTSDFPHQFSVNTFDLILGIITLQFETNLSDGNSSIRVPVSTGINSIGIGGTNNGSLDFYYYNRSKAFSTGFDYHYFPNGTGNSGAYVGPSLCYGLVNIRYRNSYSYTYHFSGLGIAFGYQFYTTPHLNFTFGGTAGLQTQWRRNNSGYNYRPLARIDVSVGWRFGAPKVVKKK